MTDSNGQAPDLDTLKTEVSALKSQLASIRKLCEAGWVRGEPCRLCLQVGSHTQHCYVRSSVGYDLLEEHEATLHENDQLRAALAAKLPVNGKHLVSGGQFKSLRARVRGRFSATDD